MYVCMYIYIHTCIYSMYVCIYIYYTACAASRNHDISYGNHIVP